MNVNLGKGFGPLDFDENGKMFSIFPEDLPYIDDDFDGDGADFTVYVDAELVEDVCNAGLDFDEFLRADENERRDMLKAAGLDPDVYDLDFDRDVRDRLEAEGYLDSEYDYDDLDDEDDEYDFDDEDLDDEDYDEDDEDEDYDEDFGEGDEDGDYGEDFDDDDFEDGDDFDGDDYDGFGGNGKSPGNGTGGDEFFGNLR